MSDDQFTKLFKYIDERLGKTEESIELTSLLSVKEVRVGFDHIAARLDDDDTGARLR